MKQRASSIVRNRPYRFILGLLLGFVFGAILVLVFSSSIAPSWIGDIILSSMTYGSFALVLFGYFYKKDGRKTFAADFLFGLGVGLILVWFVGAGNGTLTMSDINY
ncbi:MAG: hypothetical protein ACREBS_05890 [Nitrososphaerales archaeon]